ncbi:hypothetical protein CCHR01_18575 [Colletotrichum chrysophilum]|uniref:Uncharacterized protein n=1 Tax=Colletotrichum chrysophilum TaxID=1836956 RepID=A0AAD9E827_9PEZI|nr:hypothetical protein CCHR01_18575 [Colletotrichum chrysophilum]
MKHRGIPGLEAALRAACIVATGSVMLVLAMHLAARYPPHARLIRALVLSVGVLDLPFLGSYSGSPLYAGLSSKYGQLRLMMALYIGAPVLSSILDITPASTVVLFSIQILSIVYCHVCLCRQTNHVDPGDEATGSVDGACQVDSRTSGFSITWVDFCLAWAQYTIVQTSDAVSTAFNLSPEQLKHCSELLYRT